MRFLHSSDWHLGRSFFGVSLLEDQAHVLDQLVTLASQAKVDAVLLAGDVFDRSVPPADAVRLLDDTLNRLVAGAGIPVVLIAGNHDSGERLGFGARLLASRGLHVAATEPRLVTLGDDAGPVDIVAVPFAEPAASAARSGDAAIADHDRALRADLASVSFRSPGLPGSSGSPRRSRARKPARRGSRRRIAVAHAFVSGGSTSESERPLVLGNASLVAADCFDGFAYAALGHLHRPQHVGCETVHYSGSLLKYSFDEAGDRKSVSIVEIDAAGECAIEEVQLCARRDVRVLEGTLEELQRAAADDPSRDDYVLAHLGDRGALLDPMGKLRVLYPNCLHMKRDESFYARSGERLRAHRRHHDESELFQAFFRDVTGQSLDEEETRAFDGALACARRAMAEGN